MGGKAIVEALKFGLSAKRILPYAILNLLLLYAISDMFGRIGALPIEEIYSIKPFFVFYFFAFLVFILSQPFLVAAMIHQAKNFPKKIPLEKSFSFSVSVFFKTVALLLLLSLGYFIISTIPLFWSLLMIFFGIAFFYVLPAGIADNKKPVESFKISFDLFKKHVLKTFLVYLLLVFMNFILIISSFIPLFYWLIGNMLSLYSQGITDETVLARHLSILLISPTVIPLLLIPSFVMAYSSLVVTCVTTKLYFLLKKKKG